MIKFWSFWWFWVFAVWSVFNCLKKCQIERFFKPLKAIFVGTAVFSMSNTIINHVLKPKLWMKMCSCPLERMYCLKKCPGVHFTLAKCCRVPVTKLNFAGYPRCLQRNYNIHQHTHTCQQMHAVFTTEMQHTLLHKCNLPLEQRSVFLQNNIPMKYQMFL